MRKLLSLVGGIVLLLGFATPVLAQSPPPTTPPTTAGPTTGSITITIGPGGTATVEMCGFSTTPPIPPVNITWNGAPVLTITPGSDGCVRITITVSNGGFAAGNARFAAAGLQFAQTGPTVRLNGQGPFPARVGSNTLQGTGTGANGAPRTFTATVILTGAATGGGGSGLPRTGAQIIRWSIAALVLISAGAVLVRADRRRSKSRVAR